MDFATFYAQGGLFMNAISALGLVSAGMLAHRTWKLRGGGRLGATGLERSDPMQVATLASMLLLGALGTLLGFAEMSAALRSVPPEQWALALTLGFQIALTPLVWALMTVVPLVLVRGTVLEYAGRVAAVVNAARARS